MTVSEQTLPTGRRSNPQRSAVTKKRLLTATLEALGDLGYVRLSTVDVCKRAGVSRGAMLHHFATKADLVAAAIEFLVEERHLEVRQFVDSLGDAPELGEILSKLWSIYSGPTLHAWMEMVIASRTDRDLHRTIGVFNLRFVAEAEATFAQLFSNNPEEIKPAARLLMATLDGLAMNQILEPDESAALGTLKVLETLIGPWLVRK